MEQLTLQDCVVKGDFISNVNQNIAEPFWREDVITIDVPIFEAMFNLNRSWSQDFTGG